ncbi:MAG TPA: ABC transporter substrate-binding protein [Acidimicrobiia bacterium]|nr:ABC transporter substrate-binding protein [Acidimicrobiia bacterium]
MRFRFVALATACVLSAVACSGTGGATTTGVDPGTNATVAPTTLAPTTAAPSTTAPFDGTFTGADGVTTEIGDTSRIVSLTGDITEIIFSLGLGDQVVAVDITTTFPPDAERLKADGGNVGFGQALNAEAVLRYEPTLVIGDETIEPAETIEQLRNAGVPVVILPYQTTLDGVGTKIGSVARILGVEEEGQALTEEVMAEIAAAQQAADEAGSEPRVVFLYIRGPSLLFVFGADLPTNAMIEGAGAIDAGAELGTGPITVTPEALIAAAPDVIVLPESGLESLGGFDALLEIPGVAETPAGRNRAFLAYEEAYFFNLGPRAGQALAEFVADLYAIIAG